MGDGALGSDHINYLVFRYLQESGHENAAKALHGDWKRADEFSDPEQLPFAAQVKQYELINIIQDGLFHDQLHAKVTNNSPRFNLTQPSLSSPRQKDTTRARQSLNNDDFPLPNPKRAKKTATNAPALDVHVQVNGDVMDVDEQENTPAPTTTTTTATATAPAPTPAPALIQATTTSEDVESNDADAPSDTDRAMSEADAITSEDVAVIPVETSSTATQTDQKQKITTPPKQRLETLYWTLDQSESSIMHAMWNPQPAMTTRLLTVGESLCRFYLLPSRHEPGAHNTSHVDAEDMSRTGSVVTAACWHPSGRYATFAVETPDKATGETTRLMFDASPQGSKRLYEMNDYFLKDSGAVFAMRYNTSGTRLLTVSTNMKRGLLQVWDTDQDSFAPEPSAVRFFAEPIIDAVWADDDSIFICGSNQLALYKLTLSIKSQANGHSIEPHHIDVHGSSATLDGKFHLDLAWSYTTDKQWDKIRYDSITSIIVVSSVANNASCMLSRKGDEWQQLSILASDDPYVGRATAMAFEPLQERHSSASPKMRRLATAHESGIIGIYDVTSDTCTNIAQFQMGPHEAALALAWLPDRDGLAVASEEAVKIWRLSEDSLEPSVTWRAAATHWYKADENNLPNGEETADEPNLSWDAEGGRLVFAVGRNMALINLVQ